MINYSSVKSSPLSDSKEVGAEAICSLKLAKKPCGDCFKAGQFPGTESGRSQDADFRRANSLLTEISNLSWGRLKSWFERQDIADEPERFRSELPCIINNERRYLSFGSDDAKLCFTYICLDPQMRVEPLVLQQRLIFHLKWRPDQREADAQIESLVNEGALVFL